MTGDSDPLACAGIVPQFQPAVQWFNPDRVETNVSGPYIGPVASADHERVLAIIVPQPAARVEIAEIFPSGGRVPLFSGLENASATAIDVADGGRVFVRFSQAGLHQIARISPAGVLEATYPLSGDDVAPFRSIAIGNDGCTLLYATTTAIRRFDACTGTALSDFAAVAANDIDIRPDGSVLVAVQAEVRLYSANGALVETIADLPDYGFGPLAEVDEVALSADGSRIYLAVFEVCDGTLLEIAAADGRELSRRALVLTRGDSLVTGTSHAAIPTASETALFALAAMLAAAGVLLLKR